MQIVHTDKHTHSLYRYARTGTHTHITRTMKTKPFSETFAVGYVFIMGFPLYMLVWKIPERKKWCSFYFLLYTILDVMNWRVVQVVFLENIKLTTYMLVMVISQSWIMRSS